MAVPAKSGRLNNKPGEPPFQMKLEPEGKMFFNYKIGTPVSVEIRITNTTGERQTFKVKCTSNAIFRVSPPRGFVEPDEVATVTVTFDAKERAENMRHFFALYHMEFDDKTKTAREAWSPECKADGVARILAVFEEEKEEENKEEEKGGEKKVDDDEKEEDK